MPKTLEELTSDPFWTGFHWGIDVFKALGHDIDMKEVIDLFREVATEQASLANTPEEAIQDLGDGESDEMKDITRRLHSGLLRKIGDMADRRYAQEYLDVLDS